MVELTRKPPGRLGELINRNTLWARWGPVSRLIARASAPLQPATLVISMPRSGSSWVGKTLGLSDTALYLREPLTQSYLRRFGYSNPSVFPVNPEAPPAYYRAYADDAFAGLPSFRRGIVASPEQWALRERRRRRPVVKEVNPLALEWLARAYRPRVIYLIRHPAAVANSYSGLGWIRRHSRRAVHELLPAECEAASKAAQARFASTPWAEFGLFQAMVARVATRALEGSCDHRVVKYEDLCLDPVGVFRELYAFAGLAWSGEVEAGVRLQTEQREHDRTDHYGTFRNSRRMHDAWKNDVGRELLTEVREGYLSGDPPYYGPDDW